MPYGFLLAGDVRFCEVAIIGMLDNEMCKI